MTGLEASQREADEFWARFGWWISGVWILFLIFPVLQLIQGEYPAAIRVIGLGLTAGFAAVYLRGYARFSWAVGFGGARQAEALWYFGALVGIVLLGIPVLRSGSLGLIPFITSYAAFLLPRRVLYPTYAVATVLCFALPVIFGDFLDMLFLIGLNLVLMVIYYVTSSAIEHSVAAEQLRADYLVLSEQERMARDVHDGVGHSLTALNLKAQLALQLMDAGQYERARGEVEQLSSLAVSALDSVRTTVHGINREDLGAELEELRRACADNGITFNLVGNAEHIPSALRSHVAWVVREAMTNVLRHAHASAVWVRLEQHSVSVDDDGDGLGAAAEGHGIRGMRERARLFGASCTVGESALGGTSVHIDFGRTGSNT
ncbi:sensor histidine kinase [Glutamicibacter creatinolyticus]|uniref:sensor histidine kinase n=1 Tax=Micrococcaceae TaxID=1268 RepID=UPI0006CFCBE4|nr:histidine kinase [Arthrobacter sp. JCM 19049]